MELQFTEFTIEGDKEVYKLAFDFNEICEAETVTSCNLLRVLGALGRATATEVRALLYAMLKPAHPLVLLKEAGELLSKDMGAVTGAISQALGAETPSADPQPAALFDAA